MQISTQKWKQHEIQDKNPKITNPIIMDSNENDLEELEEFKRM